MRKQHFSAIVVLTGLLLGLNTMLFAEEQPSQPQQSEIKGEVVQGVPVKAEVVEKALPNYTLTLKQLIEEAGKNIKKVEKEIEKKEIFEENKTKETEALSRQKLELERKKMRPYQIDIALKEQERLREKEIERQLRELGEKN